MGAKTPSRSSSFPRKREPRSGMFRLIAFTLGFPPVFPFALLWVPAFAGMTNGTRVGRSGERIWKRGQHKSSQERQSDLRASQKSKMTLFKRVNKMDVP